MEIVVKTFKGLEEVCAQEIRELGGERIKLLNRGVKFIGNKELLYKANLHLRTALRILIPIHSFMAHNDNDLYRKVKRLPWEEWISNETTFAIDCVAFSDAFRHSKFVGLRVKDAIVDHFYDKTGQRPDVNVKRPDVRLNVHISNLDVTISVDSSGDSLHKHGYRLDDHKAPINEALAAGLLMLSGWNKEDSITDPMCGSGTFLIEAALMAKNIPPRFNKRWFGFMNWQNFDRALWTAVRLEAQENFIEAPCKFYGSDKSGRAINYAKRAAREARVDEDIEFLVEDFADAPRRAKKGMLIMNPPYGERLGEEDEMIPMYKMIGDQFKQKFPGFTAWVISSNLRALKFVGLKPSKKIPIMNAKLDCRFCKYEMYEGSKKGKYQSN